MSLLFNLATAATEIEQPDLFPFPFGMHLTFCCISLIFFIYRFASQKQPFQLIMAIAIPFSLIIWISDSRSLFYFVGLVELLLILAALISTFIKKKPAAPAENTAAPAEETASADESSSENSEADE